MNTKETFKGNKLDNITNNNIKHENDDLYHQYLKTSDFTKITIDIKYIIYQNLVKMSYSCKEMNGVKKTSMTLQCFNNDHDIEKTIIDDIRLYIKKTIKNKMNINMNDVLIMNDLYRNLNLLQNVIYPIKYSKLYTMDGEQYTTKKKIFNIIDTLYLDDVLLTILSREGILLNYDHDQIHYI